VPSLRFSAPTGAYVIIFLIFQCLLSLFYTRP
jgi:hypothetical protein